MRRAAAAAVCALAIAGCGTRHEAVTPARVEPLRVVVLAPNAGEAPIYAAERTGRFREAGLAVTTRAVASPVESASAVAAGSADLAVSTEPAVLEARDRGLRVVSVAALVRAPLSSAIWLPGSGVARPSDIARKPVGTPGLDYDRAFAQTLAGRPVATRDVGSDAVAALEQHRVAAVVGAYSNQEGVRLDVAGRKPTVEPVDRGGVPRFDGLVVVAPAGVPKADAVRSFVGALLRSTRDLMHRSAGATAAFAAAEGGADRRVATVALARTLPLMVPPASQPYGYQADWRRFASWMKANGLLRGVSDPATASTNQYLPGEGL